MTFQKKPGGHIWYGTAASGTAMMSTGYGRVVVGYLG